MDKSQPPLKSGKKWNEAFKELKRKQAEIDSLHAAYKEILGQKGFPETAQTILGYCKNHLGTAAGYIALMSKDGTQNEAIFIDNGGLSCTVDPSLPFPIRGLRDRAYRTAKTIYENDFANSQWTQWIPDGHLPLENVLFAPLFLNGKVVGLFGLANKPQGFTDGDARIASMFAEVAAVALITKHHQETLERLVKEREREVEIRNSDLQHNREENALIAEIGRIISSDLKIDQIYEVFAEAAQKLIPFDRIAINIHKPEEGKILMAFASGGGIEDRRPGDIFPLANSVNELFLRDPSPLLFQMEDEELLQKRYPSLLSTFQAGFRSMLSIPLISKGRVFGGLHFRALQSRAYTEKELGMAERIGAQIAGAIENALLFAEVERAEKELRNLSTQLLDAQERERKRLSREIHDGLSQYLVAIKFKIERALIDLKKMGIKEMATSFEALVPIIQECIKEARRIQMDLRPSILDDLGILGAIQGQIRGFQETFPHIKIHQRIEIGEMHVPDSIKITMFRVLQECFTNIGKHSGADRVDLFLGKTGEEIGLVVKDNGNGFDPIRVLRLDETQRGLGLTSMKERVISTKGSYKIESAKGEGATIYISWPLNLLS